MQSVDLLESLNVSKYKIASGDLTHYPLLEKVARTGKEIILSTGGSYMNEIEDSYKYLQNKGAKDISLLHCVSLYPTKAEYVNLYAIELLKKKFNTTIGFSDHTLGIHIPLAAIAMGATIIEKHFTLDKNMPGPDQQISTDPKELKDMVRLGTEVWQSIQYKEKVLSDDEIKMRPLMRRSIVAAQDLKAGDILSMKDIDFKRPGDGIGPNDVGSVVGRKLIADVSKDLKIEGNNFK